MSPHDLHHSRADGSPDASDPVPEPDRQGIMAALRAISAAPDGDEILAHMAAMDQARERKILAAEVSTPSPRDRRLAPALWAAAVVWLLLGVVVVELIKRFTA